MNASKAFRIVYKGDKNFMTPDFIGYRESGDLKIELSSGRGMDGDPIFGVTVVEVKGGEPKKRPDLSRLCFSRREADLAAEALVEDE